MSTEEVRQEIDRVVGECAGAVSMCWEPRPEGVFDSTQATTYVRAASDRLMSVLEAEIASRMREQALAHSHVWVPQGDGNKVRCEGCGTERSAGSWWRGEG